MLTDVLLYLRNFFCDYSKIQIGVYTISDGAVDLPFLLDGQYFRICGSIFNDGVYQYPASGLTDETFDGSIWPLRIPQAVLDIVSEIEEWQEKYGGETAGPYQSESFGGYSYTKASASSDSDSTVVTWQDVFGARLAPWRKI